MFSFFKKNNEQFNSDDKKVTFEIELTAAVLAYEIARIDGEVSDEELSVLMEEIKSISKKFTQVIVHLFMSSLRI